MSAAPTLTDSKNTSVEFSSESSQSKFEWPRFPSFTRDYCVTNKHKNDFLYDDALRRLVRSNKMPHIGSKAARKQGRFINNADEQWRKDVLLLAQRMQLMADLSSVQGSRQFNPLNEEHVNLNMRRKFHGTRYSSGDVDRSYSLSDALSRTRGIILPGYLNPNCFRKSFTGRTYKGSQPVNDPSQPQMDFEYQEDGRILGQESDITLREDLISRLSRPRSYHNIQGIIDELEQENRQQVQDSNEDEESVVDYFEFPQEQRGAPAVKSKKRPASPHWHRFRLPTGQKHYTSVLISGMDERRRAASNHVMQDLVNRKKMKDQSYQEEHKLRQKDEKMTSLKKGVTTTQNGKGNFSIEASEKSLKKIKGQKGRGTYAHTGVPVPMHDATSILHEDIPETLYTMDLDNGLPADLKHKVIRDYLRMKRWHPNEQEKLAQLTGLVEHWGKAAMKKVSDMNVSDTVPWADDNEKNLFIDIIDELKKKKVFVQFDPAKVLHTAYLRLGRETVRGLEMMCRELGKDPGLHVHASPLNLYDMNIFTGEKKSASCDDLVGGRNRTYRSSTQSTHQSTCGFGRRFTERLSHDQSKLKSFAALVHGTRSRDVRRGSLWSSHQT